MKRLFIATAVTAAVVITLLFLHFVSIGTIPFA